MGFNSGFKGLRSKYLFKPLTNTPGYSHYYLKSTDHLTDSLKKTLQKKNDIKLEVHAKYCQRNPWESVTLKILCEMKSSLVRKLASYTRRLRICNLRVTILSAEPAMWILITWRSR